jgi:hypothetical protein
MNERVAESRTAPARRFWLMVGFVLAAQLGLIFWLSKGDTPNARRLQPEPGFFLPLEQNARFPGLENPTLFALPNQRGFSAPAWLQVTQEDYYFPEWTEAPRMYGLPVARLGGDFENFLRTNSVTMRDMLKPHIPQLEPTEIYAFAPANPPTTQSVMRVEGPIAARPLLTPMPLRSWTAADALLTNTEVQVAVAPDGHVFSAVLVGRSGSPEADAFAVDSARSARFEALRSVQTEKAPVSPEELEWGRFVFKWQSLPQPTNSAPPSGN